MIDCGDDVLVITDDYGRKPGMTAEVRLFGAAVWTIRDGQDCEGVLLRRIAKTPWTP